PEYIQNGFGRRNATNNARLIPCLAAEIKQWIASVSRPLVAVVEIRQHRHPTPFQSIGATRLALRYFLELSTVTWVPAVVRASASHATGMEIGAPARARVEQTATGVASRELRK